ncbi:hypothetical protein [Actinomadura hibisca]|uniref:hypothetical protein n=1 Tax=Actinomadura hibisca TaxID=68565 RepID=UPI000A917351|nr:hypothetical protein [Actinomadura hibisca]
MRGWIAAPGHGLLLKAVDESKPRGLVFFAGRDEAKSVPTVLPTLAVTYTSTS